jgi:putative hemolysin
MVTEQFAALDSPEIAIQAETRLARRASIARRPFLSWFPGFRELSRLYRQCQEAIARSASFEARALETLELRFDVETAACSIPETGPLIVAANHPTGIADGLVLIEAVRRARADVRMVTNHLLACIPEVREACFFIDPFGGKTSIRRNVAGLRATHSWLRRGGSIVLFPAGEVAWRGWFDTIRSGSTPTDSEWYSTLGRLALATGAQVIPAFLVGRNSTPFYAAGAVHPRLRTLLLGRELLRQRGRTLSIRFGTVVPFEQIRALSSADEVTRHMRRKADSLGAVSKTPQAIPAGIESLSREIAALPAHAKLLTSASYDVFCTESGLIPNVLDEIGRLREITFRAVGEGTGQARDIDRFDFSYQHLFVWERSRREVVGAYRIGATDRILPAAGVEGLYTSTLFKYDERLLHRFGPALELGRSFVRPEYQRSHSALLLLWKGIGELVARSPQYRVLFGAVSISNRYHDTSQTLIRTFLSQHRNSDLTRFVQGVNPPPPIASTLPVSSDLEALGSLINRVEGDRGVPVLLRQYLRLNATSLGFNVDRSFADALDALMMVDLAALPAAALKKYLGAENAAAFLAYHASGRATPQRAA